MALQVTTDDLYAEACRALGEQIVTARLLARHAQELDAEIAALKATKPATEPPAPPSP